MTPLLVTPGDPAGIGPEIAYKALAARPAGSRPVVVVGDALAMAQARQGVADGPALVSVQGPVAVPGAVAVWTPKHTDEPIEVASIRASVAACLAGEAAALVTGPIHKARLAAKGFAFPGHTDFLGHLCGVSRPVMAFIGGSLRVSLATVHLPLRDVADALTVDGLEHVIRTTAQAMTLEVERPRVAVCGLNPHAGDGGLLGTEEQTVIGPAVQACARDGIDVRGPISAEAAFRLAASGGVDVVIAMYHDQGLAPLKLVDFGRSVNWTLGLPIIRTSVDHGTADDIAGQGIADPASLVAAMDLAERLVARREQLDQD
ncbi:MAG: 4-hydroxythreonine-4-phosphate dehydrogenase PdxA [Myxococcota bacterium]